MTSVERLRRLDLGRIDQFAKGGQAKVYRAPEVAVTGETRPLVFKEYRDKTISITGLDNAIAFRQRLGEYDRESLDVIANWPLRVVEGPTGGADGVILPLIEPAFFQEIHAPNGRVTTRPRDAQYLAQPKERCDRVGLPMVGLGDRYRFCRDLALAIGFLHKRNVCLGDISFSNVVYALEYSPCVYLVDCDAFRQTGTAPVVPQFHTPDWVPPEGPRVQTLGTDRYKLGLFILRTLAPFPLGAQNTNPSWAHRALDATGRQMLARALGDDSSARPEAKAWYQHFRDAMRRRPFKTSTATLRMPERPLALPAG